MSLPMPMHRDLFLCEEVTNDSVKPIINAIFNINNDDDLKSQDYRDWERKPIRLFINSPGGTVYDGLALFDAIQRSKTPVHTIAIGHAMSMSFWLFLAGHKRFVGEHSTLMYHDISFGCYDKIEGVKQEVAECERLHKMLTSMIVAVTTIEEETLTDYDNRKAEWYISAEDAIRLKIADGYYK